MKTVITSIIFIFLAMNCIGQQSDTAIKPCACDGQTVYVKFGYNRDSVISKLFSIRFDSARTTGKDYSAWKYIYTGDVDSLQLGIQNEYVTLHSFYQKQFYYIPSNAIGYVLNGSDLVPYTKPFYVWYSDVLFDDPDASIYYKILCTKITNAKISTQ